MLLIFVSLVLLWCLALIGKVTSLVIIPTDNVTLKFCLFPLDFDLP